MMTANQLVCMVFPSPRALSLQTCLSSVFFHGESQILKPKCYYRVSRSGALLFIPTSQIFSLSFSILPHGMENVSRTLLFAVIILYIFLASRPTASLRQSGTHTGDYFICGAFLFTLLDGCLFTAHAAHLGINISGNTQWHFK